jgi:DNA gyrase subunit B
VARPPLYKVMQKKHVRYVQTVAEMSKELMQRGLEGTKLHATPYNPDLSAPPAEPVIFEGERLEKLMSALEEVEEALQILERRGINFAGLISRMKDGKLPMYRVTLGKHEHWFFTAQEVDAFRVEQMQRLGHELVVADEAAAPSTTNGSSNGHADAFAVQELHEIRNVNRGLDRLRALGIQPADLVPAPRVAGREPAPRFNLESGDRRQVLAHLRELVADVRKLGERGLSITRFKGLGEMDGDELWETTLDPAKRTLVRVQLDDALKADEMFRVLMGEKVEPRRDFIQKHALEVKEIDYHGA